MPSYLEDCEEIRQLLARYCHAFDAHDAEEWAALFTDEGRFDLGDVHLQGTDALRGAVDSVPADQVMRHVSTNAVIQVDGDEARSQSYLFAMTPGSPATIIFSAVYADTLHRVDGRWRFAQRLITPDAAPDA